MTKKFYFRFILLVIAGLILNLGISYVIKCLEISIAFDHVGTVCTAILGGPIVGMIVGFVGVLLAALLTYGIEIADIVSGINGAILGGLVGWLTGRGFFKGFWKTVIMGLGVVIVYTFVVMLNVTYARMAGFGMDLMTSLTEAFAYPMTVINDLISTFLIVLPNIFVTVVILWVFFKLIGTKLLRGVPRDASVLPAEMNKQKSDAN